MRVELRDLRPQDGPLVLQWRNSPAVAPFMYSDHLISTAEHARWLAALPGAADRRDWIITFNGAPVGLANLSRIDAANRRCDWAYYLADPATRGQGVGACVEFMVLDHVFGTLGLAKLWCEVFLENEAVWKLHESFGFRREALFRRHIYKQGRPLDVVGLGLLAEEWADVRPKAAARLAAKGYDPERLRIS